MKAYLHRCLDTELCSALLHAVSISAPWEECGSYIRYESCTSFFEPEEVQIADKKNQDTRFSFLFPSIHYKILQELDFPVNAFYGAIQCKLQYSFLFLSLHGVDDIISE